MGTNELEFFQKQMESNINRASQGGVVLTHFLDEQKQAFLSQMRSQDVDIHLEGGFENAEHKRAVFVPRYLNKFDFKIKVYEILYNKRYLTLHHRKVLGSLLGLGIKRESIGDIIFQNDLVYFACTQEISAYIEQNLTTISGIPISLKEVEERIVAESKMQEQFHIVSSLRLDVLVASAYHISRSDAQTMITEGLVLLNHMECKNSSKILQNNDIISVRHKGRFCLKEIEGKTRSERLKVTLSFWV